MKKFFQVWQICAHALSSIGMAEAKENRGSDKPFNYFVNLKQLAGSFLWATLLLACAVSVAQGQDLPGTNDPQFNTADAIPNAEGLDGAIRAIAIQPDGKMILGGDFSYYNGTPHNRLIRLLADGTVDNSFNTGSGLIGGIVSIALQPDGKIIIAGTFTSYNGTTRSKIARLLADGTLDSSFNTTFDNGFGFGYGNINCMALQPDGKIVVGGDFTAYNGTVRNRIARLLTDGSLDTSFDPGNTFSFPVLAIALQPDGRILVGNELASPAVNSKIVRLLADGTQDSSFTPGTGPSGAVRSIVLQPDGKIVVGGEFSAFNSTPRNRIARLLTNGSLDETFDPGTALLGSLRTIALLPDGKVMAGGGFATYVGLGRRMIVRLHTDGTQDSSFEPGHGSFVLAMALQPDGKIVAGGDFVSYNGTPRSRIARLLSNGDSDNSFYSGAPYNGFNGAVYTMAIGSDSKTVVGGNFTSYNGAVSTSIARLLADGSLNTDFNSGTGFNGAINTIAIQLDGKMVIGGSFTSFNGTTCNRIARLLPDGSLDNTFYPGNGFSGAVNCIILQPDGKLIVGGNFNNYNNVPRNFIVRLHADGSYDHAFSGSGFNATVWALALQSDGKIVAGGSFTSYNNTARSRIARLNTEGSLDNTFQSGFTSTDFSTYVRSIVLQPDAKVVVGGFFTSYNGTERNNIVRLHTNGSLDNTFNPGTGFNHGVSPIVLQPDGKLIAGGFFTSYNGTERNYIARLRADGSLDTSFEPGNGFNNWVQSIALQPDGNVIVGGNFTSFNNIPRNRIARLYGNEGTQLSAGKDKLSEPELLAYPNPTSGDLHLAFANFKAKDRAIEVILYNNIGQPVLQQRVNPEQVQTGLKLRTANFAAGVYYLRVTGEGKTTSKQIVLQR